MKMKLSTIFTVLLAVTLIHLNAEEEKKAIQKKSISLFDGKTLKGWEACNYAGIGEIKVIPNDSSVLINRGEILSGIRLKEFDKRKLPSVNYEISMEGRRVQGDDFFCCITFPYKKTNATFVLGGWGGSVCGISSIDFMDAMENSTMSVMDFDKSKWYKVRLIVTENRIQGFVDKKRIVNVGIKGRKIGMRFGEIEESLPLGISTFQTTGEFKNIRMRPLNKKEIAAAKKLDEEDEF